MAIDMKGRAAATRRRMSSKRRYGAGGGGLEFEWPFRCPDRRGDGRFGKGQLTPYLDKSERAGIDERVDPFADGLAAMKRHRQHASYRSSSSSQELSVKPAFLVRVLKPIHEFQLLSPEKSDE